MKISVPDTIPPAAELGRVHFVGIGGAGLSGIARLMLAQGVAVSGSDGTDSPTLDQLRQAGATVWLGHRAEQVDGADLVVASTAIPEDNPEIVRAIELGVRLWPRSAGLASVMSGQRVLAVAGTHGKTTTTSLLIMALEAAGLEPSYAVGGDLTQTGSNAAQGAGEWFVAEADESDGAFLVYRPYAAIVTNVDGDHLDHFGSMEAYAAAFEEFLDTIDPTGFLVAILDDPGAQRLATIAAQRGLRVIGVGEAAQADLRAVALHTEGGRTSFEVVRGAETLGQVTLQIPGRHYALDALAALALGLELGGSFADLVSGLGSFQGTRRRMERKGEAAGVRVYDSYAHHPTEIAADLAAARSLAGAGRLLVAFQPHLVSRTRIFGPAMGAALGAADEVVVLDVYLAREAADPAVTGALVAEAVPGGARFEPDFDRVPEHLVVAAADGDLILTLGAGTVTQLGPRILDLLGGADGEHGS
ncbi:MAG: UDP-N-acetylmuramate--L-alanine ligase [Nocardioides sp.]